MREILNTILGTLKGANNEGSSKRITAAYLAIVTLSILTISYSLGFMAAYNAEKPTTVHLIIAEAFIYIFALALIALASVLGLTNLDKWIDIIPFIKKGKDLNTSKEQVKENDKY